ncbi:MAG: hypothetical protein LBG64_00535 [Pseudomonadales bacterium]|jgi:large-conductance mechanosensitive channel|nr:hypothetical protein [Pseudomonadales bacterium]
MQLTIIFGVLILLMAGAIIFLLVKLIKQTRPQEEGKETDEFLHRE